IWLTEGVKEKDRSKLTTNLILDFMSAIISTAKSSTPESQAIKNVVLANVEALKKHQVFFKQQLTSDLDSLKEVLIATGKEQNAKAISNYEKKNLRDWDANFNPLERILNQFKPYVDVYVEGIKKPAPPKRLFGKN